MSAKDVKEVVSIITQKGFSGTAGALGVYVIFNANLESEHWGGFAIVGLVLITLAVIVEYASWHVGNNHLRSQLKMLQEEKKSLSSRIEKYDYAFIENLKNSPGTTKRNNQTISYD